MAQWSRRVICNFVSHCAAWMYLRKNDEAENVCNQHTAAARRAGCLYFRLPFINTIKILLCSRRRLRFCFCSGGGGGDAFSLRRPNLLLIWIWLIRRPGRRLLFQQCFRAFPPHTMPKDNYCGADRDLITWIKNELCDVPPWNVINFELIPHGAASVSGVWANRARSLPISAGGKNWWIKIPLRVGQCWNWEVFHFARYIEK